jgi:hypothetical protein
MELRGRSHPWKPLVMPLAVLLAAAEKRQEEQEHVEHVERSRRVA